MTDSGGGEGSDLLTPQGKHHPWYSMSPLTEAGEWVSSRGTYFKNLSEANGGAPIYKAHPGMACIALTDHASGEWFFSQPESVLDREVSDFLCGLFISSCRAPLFDFELRKINYVNFCVFLAFFCLQI